MQTEAPSLPLVPTHSSDLKKRNFSPKKQRRFSPLALSGIVATLLLVIGSGTFLLVQPRLTSRAANDDDAKVNPNCTILVPANPLSAQGLATPYQLSATNRNDGSCHESNAAQSAFVQGVIYDPASGTFAVYNPLIVDKGTKPLIAPTVPTLPKGAIVALWFGFNATNLLLKGAQGDTLLSANCVNGLGNSLFTQFAYCNAPNFFAKVNQDIAAHKVQVPALGIAKDGKPCPTMRDFSVVDQDQSDNVQTRYLTVKGGRTAQFSAANQAALNNPKLIANPSDNGLLTNFINPTLGCKAWTAPDLADDGNPVASLALDELQASFYQRSPIALVPLNNPMTAIIKGKNTIESLQKTNLYRYGVDQPLASDNTDANGTMYCQNLVDTGIPRLKLDKQFTIDAATPDALAANNLFTFLAQRLQGSYDNLNCSKLLHKGNPVKTKTNKKGVVISASFKD